MHGKRDLLTIPFRIFHFLLEWPSAFDDDDDHHQLRMLLNSVRFLRVATVMWEPFNYMLLIFHFFFVLNRLIIREQHTKSDNNACEQSVPAFSPSASLPVRYKCFFSALLSRENAHFAYTINMALNLIRLHVVVSFIYSSAENTLPSQCHRFAFIHFFSRQNRRRSL